MDQFKESYQQYNNPVNRNSKSTKKKSIDIVMIVVFFLGVALIASMVYFGYSKKSKSLADEQRLHDISQVVKALDQFYMNSSSLPGNRYYPIAICSSELNEVDYEYTLKKALAGSVDNLSSHSYIFAGDFPRDRDGNYTDFLVGDSPEHRCLDNIPIEKDFVSYPDGSQRCKFDLGSNKSCYLYTSSANGDFYRIAFFARSSKKFIVIEKKRNEPLKISFHKE